MKTYAVVACLMMLAITLFRDVLAKPSSYKQQQEIKRDESMYDYVKVTTVIYKDLHSVKQFKKSLKTHLYND